MKIEYARTIPLSRILPKAGLKLVKASKTEQRYRSPFSEIRGAYLSVNLENNTWTDSTSAETGGVMEFVTSYLRSQDENHTETDCLRWLKNMLHAPLKIDLSVFPDYTTEDRRYQLRGIAALSNFMLLRYLEERGIDRNIASCYLKEVRILDTAEQKIFRALGFKNEDGGYAVRNSFRKAHIGPATISFIRGTIAKPDGIRIFKDVSDFLSLLTLQGRQVFKEDSIIINSYSCLNDVMPYIANYGYKTVRTWLPNDDWGRKATANLENQFHTEQSLEHYAMNETYQPFRSPNEWLLANSCPGT
jgi:hypothetical protein